MLNKFLVMFLTAVLLTFASATTTMASPGGGSGGGNGGGELVPLSEDEVTGLLFMREEEKLARDSYLTLGGIWDLTIFFNIASSEQQHMDALLKLIDKYGLPDPVAIEPDSGKFVNEDLQALYDFLMFFGEESLMNALYVGILIEETDIHDIEHEIEIAEDQDYVHEDLISTYESLMCGSRNHLRAFVRQIEDRGDVYDPADRYTDEDDIALFLDIAYSDMEQDCDDDDYDDDDDDDDDDEKGKKGR